VIAVPVFSVLLLVLVAGWYPLRCYSSTASTDRYRWQCGYSFVQLVPLVLMELVIWYC
jgi:hypothetical protein